MHKLSQIGSYLKKIYRIYSVEVLDELQSHGFLDLRPSFLEILMFISENNASSIKQIGQACGLKKQTMTSHLNELEKRGYTLRKTSERDRREQLVYLSEYGEKFRFILQKALEQKETEYTEKVGQVELDRIILTLEKFHDRIKPQTKVDKQQTLI